MYPVWIIQSLVGHELVFVVLQLDNKGRNFLHIAIQKGDMESVLFLISVHANINSRVQDSSQMTPLHLAVVAGAEMISRNLVNFFINQTCSFLASVGNLLQPCLLFNYNHFLSLSNKIPLPCYFRLSLFLSNYLKYSPIFLQIFCIKPYVPREPQRDPSNHRLYECSMNDMIFI